MFYRQNAKDRKLKDLKPAQFFNKIKTMRAELVKKVEVRLRSITSDFKCYYTEFENYEAAASYNGMKYKGVGYNSDEAIVELWAEIALAICPK